MVTELVKFTRFIRYLILLVCFAGYSLSAYGQCDPCFAIVDGGDWDDPNSWSASSGGGVDGGIPDATSTVHIGETGGGMTINLNIAEANALNLTIYDQGTILHTVTDSRLTVNLGGSMTIEDGGLIDGNGQTQADLRIRGDADFQGTGTRVTGIRLIILTVNNAGSPMTISGSGNISATELRIANNNRTYINDITGNVTVARIRMNASSTFTNNETITVTDDLRLYTTNSTVNNNGTITVNDDLRMQNNTQTGNIINNTGTLTIGDDFLLNDAGLTINNTGTFTHNGDYTGTGGTETFSNNANGIWNTSASDHSSINTFNCSTNPNTVNYELSGDQEIYTQSDGSYHNLIIAGGGTKTLSGSTVINNQLTMTSGNIDLTSGNLTLGISDALPGTLSHTSGQMYGGSFTQFYAASATIGDTDDNALFPLGTGGANRFFYVAVPSGPSTGGTVTITYNDDIRTNTINFTDVDDAASIVKQHRSNWTVTTSTLAGGSYNLKAIASGFENVGALSDLRLITSSTTVGLHVAGSGTLADPEANRGSVALADLTNSFHFGSTDGANTPLPIELLSFTVEFELNTVKLNWSTISELNNEYFTIERSADGVEFHKIARIDGAGTTDNQQDYFYIDRTPLHGTSYYRLKQIDYDGQFEIFDAIKVTSVGSLHFMLYPNPVINNSFTIVSTSDINRELIIEIFDMQGRLIHFGQKQEKRGIHISLPKNINTGIYTAIIKTGTDVLKRRLLIK